MHDHAHGQPEEAMHAPHQLALIFREIIVYGDDVNALARQRV